eukprot:CAMPEP_0179195398 /NCGR_PEP_ID=MMETSP0796-20121207/97128_1 /TAXON_ID=73915 /ORGANISM="Pyrodinium bahamense, Strain pbaha01" /LENGTH=53 /DNA_ID=CAMNT_0020899745 /DNA_START=65 /DNA_END=223 /DNA_ORIENTATION=+
MEGLDSAANIAVSRQHEDRRSPVSQGAASVPRSADVAPGQRAASREAAEADHR